MYFPIIIIVSLGGIIITPSGSPIAGEMYTLECLAGGSEVESFQWLGPPDGTTSVIESSPRVNILSSAATSQLQFRPIQQSDNGSYSCRVTVDELTRLSEPVAINVNGNVISYDSNKTMHPLSFSLQLLPY